ncbi:hypothetical protein V8F20_006901 [Naviculisporaceae sp. PSN 640]
MAKLAGDAADKITRLQKLVEALQAENAALRRKVRLLESNSSPSQRSNASDSSSSPGSNHNRRPTTPRLAPVHSPRRGSRRPELLARQDQERMATFNGRRYVYRKNGDLMELDERQANTLTQEAFMLPTTASNGKRHFSDGQTFEFRRRRTEEEESPRTESPDSSWDESRPVTPEESDDESQRSVFEGYLPSYGAVRAEEPAEEPADDSPQEPGTPQVYFSHRRVLIPKDLGDDLNPEHTYIRIDSTPANDILDKALKIFRTVLWEKAAVYWPGFYKRIKKGEYLVNMSGTEMHRNLEDIDLSDITPNTQVEARLEWLLRRETYKVRNSMSHKKWAYLSHASFVDNDLKGLQEAVLLMGDTMRGAELRKLRDKINDEAKKSFQQMVDLHCRIELPGFEMQEEDLEFLHEHDYEFAEIMRTDLRLTSRPLAVPAPDVMVQVARYYLQQGNLEKSCEGLVSTEHYAWALSAAQNPTPCNF